MFGRTQLVTMSADDSQKLSIRDLPTRSITLYPGSASVVRDIPNIIVKVT